MRRKISKRRRRRAILLGAEILKERWLSEPGWKRKDIGYGVDAKYKDWNILVCGYDELEAYRNLIECIKTWNEDEMRY